MPFLYLWLHIFNTLWTFPFHYSFEIFLFFPHSAKNLHSLSICAYHLLGQFYYIFSIETSHGLWHRGESKTLPSFPISHTIVQQVKHLQKKWSSALFKSFSWSFLLQSLKKDILLQQCIENLFSWSQSLALSSVQTVSITLCTQHSTFRSILYISTRQ